MSSSSHSPSSHSHRGQLCDNWIRTFVPSLQPGQFKLGDIKSESWGSLCSALA